MLRLVIRDATTSTVLDVPPSSSGLLRPLASPKAHPLLSLLRLKRRRRPQETPLIIMQKLNQSSIISLCKFSLTFPAPRRTFQGWETSSRTSRPSFHQIGPENEEEEEKTEIFFTFNSSPPIPPRSSSNSRAKRMASNSSEDTSLLMPLTTTLSLFCQQETLFGQREKSERQQPSLPSQEERFFLRRETKLDEKNDETSLQMIDEKISNCFCGFRSLF